jgi:hypothetical protein
MLQYVYLLREREFIRLNENTFKVGKTTQEPYKRFSGYPKGSEVLAFIAVGDCHKMETEILEHFREHFQQRKEYGSEYFQGDRDKIIHSFLLCVEDPFTGYHRRLANRAPDTAPSALDSDSSAADSDDADSAANEPLLDLHSPVILLEDQCKSRHRPTASHSVPSSDVVDRISRQRLANHSHPAHFTSSGLTLTTHCDSRSVNRLVAKIYADFIRSTRLASPAGSLAYR